MSDIKRSYAFGIIPFYRRALGEYVFLLGCAQDSDGRESFWKFPKGHKHHEEEDDIDAAIRELEEETGIVLPPKAVIRTVSFKEEYFYERAGDIVRKVNTFWLGQAASAGSEPPVLTIDHKEFKECRWIGFEEAVSLLPENSRDFFEDAHTFLIKNRV